MRERGRERKRRERGRERKPLYRQTRGGTRNYCFIDAFYCFPVNVKFVHHSQAFSWHLIGLPTQLYGVVKTEVTFLFITESLLAGLTSASPECLKEMEKTSRQRDGAWAQMPGHILLSRGGAEVLCRTMRGICTSARRIRCTENCQDKS